MDRVSVKSSNICSIGYDEEASVLEVEFNNGGIYQYLGVPDATFQKLMSASSKGSYFNQAIRDNFRMKKLR